LLQEFDAGLQFPQGGSERGDLGLQARNALDGAEGIGRCLDCIGVWVGLRFGERSEEMGVAGLAGAGLAGKDDGKGADFVADCIGSRAGREAFEGGLDSGEVVEAVEAVCTAAELAGGLGPAKHEEAEDRGLVAAKIEDSADAVLVLGNAGVTDWGDKSDIFEGVKGLADLLFGEIKDGVATGALVTRVDQSVEREWVVFRRGDLFFNEGAEDAELDGVEVHVYKGAIGTAGMIMKNTYVD
jgi:hypothetical protein